MRGFIAIHGYLRTSNHANLSSNAVEDSDLHRVTTESSVILARNDPLGLIPQGQV